MKRISDPKLRQLALDAAHEATTDIGRMHTNDMLDILCGKLDKHPDLHSVLLRKAAQGALRDLGERRSPRRNRITGGLYHPDSIMKLGHGVWVWMKDATFTDMTAWGRVAAQNTIRTITADGAKQKYVFERTDAFRQNPTFERLAPLEAAVFDYQHVSFDDLDVEDDWAA